MFKYSGVTMTTATRVGTPVWPMEQTITRLIIVVVCHVIIAAIGYDCWKKCWPMEKGCVLRTAVSPLI